jgi:hypothetical protein
VQILTTQGSLEWTNSHPLAALAAPFDFLVIPFHTCSTSENMWPLSTCFLTIKTSELDLALEITFVQI